MGTTHVASIEFLFCDSDGEVMNSYQFTSSLVAEFLKFSQEGELTVMGSLSCNDYCDYVKEQV